MEEEEFEEEEYEEYEAEGEDSRLSAGPKTQVASNVNAPSAPVSVPTRLSGNETRTRTSVETKGAYGSESGEQVVKRSVKPGNDFIAGFVETSKTTEQSMDTPARDSAATATSGFLNRNAPVSADVLPRYSPVGNAPVEPTSHRTADDDSMVKPDSRPEVYASSVNTEKRVRENFVNGQNVTDSEVALFEQLLGVLKEATTNSVYVDTMNKMMETQLGTSAAFSESGRQRMLAYTLMSLLCLRCHFVRIILLLLLLITIHYDRQHFT